MPPTCPPTKNVSAFYHIPGKIVNGLAGHQEVPGTLGQLGKINYIILSAACIGIDGGFASHKTDVSFISVKSEEDRLLTKKEVCSQLGIGETSVWNLTKRGRLTAVKVGKSVRYRQSEVTDILNSTND